jgi:anti-anti-sigma factor
MQVNWKKKGTVLLIELKGRMDTTMPREFETRLLDLIKNGEIHLVFDFSQVEYITTNGLRLLLRAFKEVTSVNGRMVFHSLNGRVRRVFEIAGLTMIFRIYETREEAFAGALYTGMLPVNILKNFESEICQLD